MGAAAPQGVVKLSSGNLENAESLIMIYVNLHLNAVLNCRYAR
jgi:hypothetical protein